MTPRAIATHRDSLLAAAVGTLYVLEVLTQDRFAGDRAASLVVAVLFSATLAARLRAPLLGLAAGVGVIAFSNLADLPVADTASFLCGFAIAVYSTGRYAAARAGLVVLAALPLAVIEPGEPFSLADSAFIAIFVLGPWLGGWAMRRRAAAGEREAREAVAEERARIARELHDVVAHAISVIVLQARGGRRMLASDPEETRRALDVIERAGEQALGEMRRLLGLLRDTGEDAGLAPRPGLARMDDLAAELTATGLPVELKVEGEPFDVPPGIDISAYRIVQEALTNALKHAGPARAEVTVRYTAAGLELEVADDGAGDGNGGGSGHGLVGLRERVAVLGGELESGARPEGGYTLRATLPVR